jgi:hypothetical protein
MKSLKWLKTSKASGLDDIVDEYLRNNPWKSEFVSSFNMGNIIFVRILSRAKAMDKMQRK